MWKTRLIMLITGFVLKIEFLSFRDNTEKHFLKKPLRSAIDRLYRKLPDNIFELRIFRVAWIRRVRRYRDPDRNTKIEMTRPGPRKKS